MWLLTGQGNWSIYCVKVGECRGGGCYCPGMDGMISLVRHQEIVRLNKELSKLEEESEHLSRQLQGFLALPPSKELASLVDCILLSDMKL